MTGDMVVVLAGGRLFGKSHLCDVIEQRSSRHSSLLHELVGFHHGV